jgi:hypothetical protein
MLDNASRWVRASIISVASGLALTSLGCSSGGELPLKVTDTGPPSEPDPNVIRLPFLVDDYFVPNGCFGDGNCKGGVIDINSRACQDTPASVQSVCRRYTYKPLAVGTAGYKGYLGILFQDVVPGETNIGKVRGLPVQAGAKRSVFWAKLGAGELTVAFRAGGANNWDGETDSSLPYKDSFGVPGDTLLDTTYQQIVIDLSDASYSEVVSPFGWAIVTKDLVDPPTQIDLYIADVRWE